MLADTEASKAVSCSATPASSAARDSVAGVGQHATCMRGSSRFALWDLRSVALVALSMKSRMPRSLHTTSSAGSLLGQIILSRTGG